MARGKLSTCLLCDASTQSSRNTFAIFTQAVSTSDKKVVQVLSSILNTELKESSVHSAVICKKCYRVCNEIDEIQERLTELSKDLLESYEKTLRKQNEGILEFNEGEESGQNSADDKDTFEPSKPAPVKKKAKAVPPSVPVVAKPAKLPPAVPPPVQSRTVVTVKMVDPLDPDIKLEQESDSGGEDSHLSQFIDTQEVDEESEDDRMEEILEDDLKEGEMLFKLEVKEEQIEKRGRGRPRKTPKLEDGEHMTPEMVIQKGDNSLYRCLLCESVENCDAKQIVVHVSTTHHIKLHICDMCGQEFMKRSELRAHLDEHMSMQEERDFQCEVCNRIFNNLRLYRVHRKTHLRQVKQYICELCGRRFASRGSMEEHLHTHTGVRPHECAVCHKTFATKYAMKAHTKTHLERERHYSCSNCGKSFYTQQNLVQHERTHWGVKEYVCTECGKGFGTARNLDVHLSIHSGNRPFICRTCGKTFARKAEVMDHERTHTGERPYQCEFCGAQFSQRSNLQSHKRATHFDDKRYPCNACDKAFKRRRLLDYHVKAAHTGERPHQCSECNASFIYPEHHKKHMRIHTGEKPYQCEVCGKAFNSRDNRNAHRFVHSDKKPYECVVCGAGFMRKPLLYAHMTFQGHETETIVVNQPQLSVKESWSDGEEDVHMTFIQEEDGSTRLVPLTFSPKAEEDSQSSCLSELPVEQLIINENGQVELKSSMDVVTLQEGSMVHDATVLETEDGPVHLVQIRLPDERGELRETWVNIIPSEEILPAS